LGYNTRACGSNQRYALIPLSVNLIEWAQHIIFVNQENIDQATETFARVGYAEDIMRKAQVLDIPDVYNAFSPELVKIWEDWFGDARERLALCSL
jgi:predicted protein tyrosine phosphatase